jgi:hypothetical protein
VKVHPMLVIVLIAGFSSAAPAADPKEIQQKVVQLNAQSVKLLGISLNALRYLAAADANSYHHLGHLEQTGEIKFVRELETKGYVKTQVMKALPDGTQRNETFLRVIPVGNGIEVQRSMTGLQHNSALQPTR